MRLDADRTEEISENLEPPTFNNTVLALEQSGALLGQLNEAFYMVVGANNNDVLEKNREGSFRKVLRAPIETPTESKAICADPSRL